ncbi:hypothetical protein PSPO01_09034 [Paraphaeosphaeria sporulosa]
MNVRLRIGFLCSFAPCLGNVGFALTPPNTDAVPAPDKNAHQRGERCAIASRVQADREKKKLAQKQRKEQSAAGRQKRSDVVAKVHSGGTVVDVVEADMLGLGCQGIRA